MEASYSCGILSLPSIAFNVFLFKLELAHLEDHACLRNLSFCNTRRWLGPDRYLLCISLYFRCASCPDLTVRRPPGGAGQV